MIMIETNQFDLINIFRNSFNSFPAHGILYRSKMKAFAVTKIHYGASDEIHL